MKTMSSIGKIKIHAVMDQITENMQSYERESQDSRMEGVYLSIETVRFLLDKDIHLTRILSEMKHLTEQINSLKEPA
jgi:hypothetical protein